MQREHLADGSFRLRCEGALANCLKHVSAVCRDAGFDVLEARDIRSYVGPEQTERETRSSEALVSCHPRGKRLFEADSRRGPERPVPMDDSEPGALEPGVRLPKQQVCTPGATQVCVGVGACSGGQACLSDGSGFGPCRCAGRSASAPSPAADEPELEQRPDAEAPGSASDVH